VAKQCVINVDLAFVYEEPGRKKFLHALAWGDQVEVVETTADHLRITPSGTRRSRTAASSR
jgi:hypothetical protein